MGGELLVKTLRCIGLKSNGSRCTREKEFEDDQAPKEWRCWQHPLEVENVDKSAHHKKRGGR